MFKRTLAPVFVLIAFIAAWGQDSVQIDVIIRDFPVTYPGFEEFDSQKSSSSRQCTYNGNSTAVTKGMVQNKLDYSQCSAEEKKGDTDIEKAINGRYCARPLPANPAPSKMCYGENLQSWFTDGSHTRTFKEPMTLILKDGLYEIQYNSNTSFNWNGYGASTGYFPLDKYDNPNNKEYYAPGKTFGMQSLMEWCPTRTTTGNCGALWFQGGPKDPNAAKKATDSLDALKKVWHNFGFTVAGSAEFKYVRGNNDRFEFTGDDDMWVFIDGELVMDLGGIHGAESGSVSINTVATERGWEDGTMHAINFFYAERQTMASNLRLRFALTDIVPSQYGAPSILKAETNINENGASETMIWVSTKLDIPSLERFYGTDLFPIIIRKSDPSNTSVSGYKLSSIVFTASDGKNGYIYTITGDVCKGNDCTLSIGSGDSLSFNVKLGDLTDAGYRDPDRVTLTSEEWYVKSLLGIPSTKVAWGVNTTKMPPVEFKPAPGDQNPIKPLFNVDQWFSGNPNGNDGSCDGCGQLKNDGRFPNNNGLWDPVEGKLVSEPNNPTVHGFGTKGTPIPPQRAGELILTAFPNASGMVKTIEGEMTYEEWMKDENKKLRELFGLPPEAEADANYLYGIANPKKQAEDGGYQFVKNGFPNESSVGGNGQIAPTRCVADRSDIGTKDEPRINCLNFSLLAAQPFILSVTLYDQLGNFVTQYREKITESEFRGVVQGANYVDPAVGKIEANKDCEAPNATNYGKPNVLTVNGLVKVNVNIYPFSKEGRRFGNGVYIAKIDRVDLPYGGCWNNKGKADYIVSDYVRYHAEQKFPWMRAKSSSK